jgi:hypothetical protein
MENDIEAAMRGLGEPLVNIVAGLVDVIALITLHLEEQGSADRPKLIAQFQRVLAQSERLGTGSEPRLERRIMQMMAQRLEAAG